ncbi:hypothetical protein PV325_006827 [Microctonus aethiopoides]|nr:hypothetical protein PV325_006827 [Microctonus aethiopoides]
MTLWTIVLYQLLIFIIIPKSLIISASNDTFISNGGLVKIDGRIVNGTKATTGEFPYIVSLRRTTTKSFFCGGNVINERWILTAGHCMFQNDKLISESSILVIGGELQLNPPSIKRQTSYVTKRILHPQYDHDYLKNDIALLLMKTPFIINSYLNLIQLALTMPAPGTKCIVAGWGYLEENNHIPSNDLMYVELPLLSNVICEKLLGDLIYIGPSIFCAGYEEGTKDSCQGDSGGPLVCNGLLTGIVSGGEGCARPKRPGFYTKTTQDCHELQTHDAQTLIYNKYNLAPMHTSS